MRIVRLAQPEGPVMGVDFGDGTVRRSLAHCSTALVRLAVAGGIEAVLTDDVIQGASRLSPINDPGKIIGIGLNYLNHANEAQEPTPREPLVFAKFATSIIGPDAPIRWSKRLTTAVDYEAELAVVIGKPARNVSLDHAMQHVFGYTCLNDVSARDLQFTDGQWVRAKSLDSFCPIGPWIVTADEIPAPQELSIRCVVGGEIVQDGGTHDMIFGVAELIARLSRSFTLEAGDVIATGTPSGVGWFRDPKRLLGDGDDVVISIDGIGSLRNPVVVDD